MSKKKRIWLTALLISGITGSVLGCNKVEDTGNIKDQLVHNDDTPTWQLHVDEPVEFNWYIDFSWYTTPWGNNLVSKAITEETGVDINFIVPTGNETEKLNSMIASDTLPDLITLGWWRDQVEELIEKDMVHALNVLADQYDPYFYKVIDEDVVAWYEKPDGNLYFYPNSSVTPKDYEENENIGSNYNFLVRKDIYEAIGSPDMTTPEGFIGAVEKAVEAFPEISGEKLIPIGSDEFTDQGCNSFDKYLQNFLAIPYEENGQYYDRYTDPEYIRWLKTFRQLNELGYLSSEIFVDKRIQMEEKMAKGRYFCLLYQGSDIQAAQKALYAKDPNTIYISVDGPKNSKGQDPMLPAIGISGWTVTLISKNCEEPDRALQFLSYMLSEQGQKMTFLGVEDESYHMINGEPVIEPEVLHLLNTDRGKYDEIYGGNNAYWMLQDNIMQLKWDIAEEDYTKQLREWTYPYTHYIDQYHIVFKNGTTIANKDSKIKKEWGKVLPQLLLSSEDEFDQILQGFINRRLEYGYEDVLEESRGQMIEAKKKLGIDKGSQ